MTKFLWIIILSLVISNSVSAKFIKGQVYTSTKWAFITRFVFSDEIGGLDYSVTFPVDGSCAPKIAFYHSNVWSSVYPRVNLDCALKMNYAVKSYDVEKALNTSHVYVHCGNDDELRYCIGKINFLTMTDQWWFLVLSQCHTGDPLDVQYQFTITDGDSWEKQVSADESNMFLLTAVCLIIITIALAIALIFHYQLLKAKFLHTPYKTFLVGLSYEECALVFEIGYYMAYIETGSQFIAVKTMGSFLHASSEAVFIILLISLAKGFTVTRGRLPKLTKIRLGIFTALYGIAYIIYFAMEIVNQELRLLRNSLDDGAEIGLLVMRMIAWAWFLYAVIQTIDKYPEKLVFYSWFCVLFSVWFLAKPGITVFARFTITDWKVNKVVKGVDLASCTAGYVIFLHLTRPTVANRQFPFHVRTNQIDVVTTNETDDFPHTEEYSQLKKNINGELETSLTNISNADNETDTKVNGIASIWFSGKH